MHAQSPPRPFHGCRITTPRRRGRRNRAGDRPTRNRRSVPVRPSRRPGPGSISTVQTFVTAAGISRRVFVGVEPLRVGELASRVTAAAASHRPEPSACLWSCSGGAPSASCEHPSPGVTSAMERHAHPTLLAPHRASPAASARTSGRSCCQPRPCPRMFDRSDMRFDQNGSDRRCPSASLDRPHTRRMPSTPRRRTGAQNRTVRSFIRGRRASSSVTPAHRITQPRN